MFISGLPELVGGGVVDDTGEVEVTFVTDLLGEADTEEEGEGTILVDSKGVLVFEMV